MTAARFYEKHPDNPVALASMAVSVARHDAPRAARLLQQAILKAGDQLPLQVYDALSVVGVGLFGAGFIPAARAHWMLQFSFSGGKDEQVLRLIMQLQGSAEIPLLWKDDLQLAECPADALWRGSFEGSLAKARSGHWLTAADELAALSDRAGSWPPISRNLAILRTWLGEEAAAVTAWRRYATEQVPLDDAVEAEAMAQLLDHDAAELVDLIKVVYPIHETENLLAQLTVHRQSLSMPGDLRLLAGENEVPPKGYFSLLDRPQPESASGLTVETVPRIVGQVLVYGKQTDREARAELIVNRRNLAASRAALEAVGGSAVGAAGDEEVASRASAGDDALALEWYLPEDIAPAERQQLLRAGHRQRLLAEWPEKSQRLFGGQTPRQAAADPRFRIPLLAAILNLELASDLLVGFDFNELRGALGLPLAEKIDPVGQSVLTLSLVRLGRLEMAKLRDEDLLIAYDRASQARFMHAITLLGRELVGRPSLDAEVDKGAVFAMLAQLAGDPEQAAKDLDAGRKIAEAGGKSTARFDLIELAIHMGQGDIRAGRPAAQTHPDRTPARAGHRPGALFAVGPVGRDSSRRLARRRTSHRCAGIGGAGRRRRGTGQQDLDSRLGRGRQRRQETDDLDPRARLNRAGKPTSIRWPAITMVDSEFDVWHMARALELAKRGLGHVEPNPMVGCTIVHDGEVIGEGWHRQFGGPHAEIEALRVAGSRAAGATLYVTLEPCSHFGKTPPCTKAILAAGIRRVVAAMVDPFPAVSGQGLNELRSAGLDVSVGLSADEARRLNAPYFKLVETGRPWTIAKWAMTLDGKIATRGGRAAGSRARRPDRSFTICADALTRSSSASARRWPTIRC